MEQLTFWLCSLSTAFNLMLNLLFPLPTTPMLGVISTTSAPDAWQVFNSVLMGFLGILMGWIGFFLRDLHTSWKKLSVQVVDLSAKLDTHLAVFEHVDQQHEIDHREVVRRLEKLEAHHPAA